MNDGDTWQLADLAAEVSTANQDYDEVRDFVESILDTVPEIIKAGDSNTGCPSINLQQLSQNISL